MVELHHRIVRPKLLLDFLPSYKFATACNQHPQHLGWLFLQQNGLPVPLQFPSLEVEFENPKSRAVWECAFHEDCTGWRRVYYG
jgi:hypothetical protein